MDRQALEELIQADIDGALSSHEHAELARVLMQDPEARRLHDEYRRLDRVLRGIPKAEPPPELRAEVLAATSGAAGARPPASRWSAWRVAASVLGGLLVVGLAYLLLDAREYRNELQGSVIATPGERLDLHAEGAEMQARALRSGEQLRLEVRVSAARPVEVVVNFDATVTTFLGGADLAPQDAQAGRLAIAAEPGSRQMTFQFSGHGSVSLQLRAGDQVLDAGILRAD